MEAEKKSRNLIFGTTTAILVALLGVLGWQFIEQKNAADIAKSELNELTLRDSLVYEFNVLKYEYKTISSQNNKYRSLLSGQSEKISELITEIDLLKNSTNDSKLELAYQKLGLLKAENNAYTYTIEKLNSEKEVLLVENNALRTDLNLEKKYSRSLESKVSEVETKTMLSNNLLSLKEVTAIPINYNIEGKEVVAKKANKTKKIRVCFTTNINPMVKTGRKTAYINIYSPTGTLITKTAEGFNYKGGSKTYTLSSMFNYQNRETDVCSYWFATKQYLPGTYKTEIIVDSQIIGKSSFVLQ